MRIILLSSFSILGGLTNAYTQNWVPYSFYNFKQTPQKAPAQDSPDLTMLESTASIFPDYEFIESEFYADPDIAYSAKEPRSQQMQPQQPPSRICSRQVWLEGDYILAWMKKADIDVPLITTGSPTDPIPGAIGEPNTRVVYGDQHLNFHRFQGVRGGIGTYLNPYRSFSIDVDGFWIFSKTDNFKIVGNGSSSLDNPVIARPYFDVRTSTEKAELISDLDFFSGSSSAKAKSQLWGAEVNLGYHPCKNVTVGDIFFGFRYLRLREKITVQDEKIPLEIGSGVLFNGNMVNPPDTLEDEDVFRASNKFYGGQIGGRAEFANNWFFFNFFGKVALGVTDEHYKTQGETIWESSQFGDQFASGGILVQDNNQVNRKHTLFAWVPEVGVNIGIEPLNHLRFHAGYSFLWWSKVIRSGEQINRNVNSGQIPSSPDAFFTPAMQEPDHHLAQKSFWLQTLNFGIAFEF